MHVAALLLLVPLSAVDDPLAALADGCGAQAPPASWSLVEMSRQAPPAGEGDRLHLLAWQILEDDRPLRVESALVLRQAGDVYHLLHFYRHPAEEGARWRLATTEVRAEPEGFVLFRQALFDHRPGNAEIYAELGWERVNWRFGLYGDWRRLGAGVCESAWRAATGEAPTRFFAVDPD